MANSKIDDKLNNNKWDKVLQFIKQNVRYIAAGALFVVLVLVLVNCGMPKGSRDGQAAISTETSTEQEAFAVDAHQEVNDLINQYYTAYAAGDVDTIAAIATPLSENEKSYVSVFSQYVEQYQNIKCYTKSGLDANSYLVSVNVEIKFKDVDTVAPGLDFFYVRTNESGALYIDNLYSQYNLRVKENALDTSVQSLIDKYENSEDVVALQQEVQKKYDEAIAADEKLATLINTTLPNAITDWASTVVSQNTETTEAQEPTETTEASEAPEETQASEETAQNEEQQNTSETVYTLDIVNVRASADTESEKIGSLDKGKAIARTGTEGEWSVVDFGGQTGYIKTEFLTTDASAAQQESANEQESAPSQSAAEGTVITLKDSTNIRSGMSETSDKVGTAFAGEKVTVVMSYAEGWTKVSWNNKTGYVKTSLLQ